MRPFDVQRRKPLWQIVLGSVWPAYKRRKHRERVAAITRLMREL